jgi:zinc protease
VRRGGRRAVPRLLLGATLLGPLAACGPESPPPVPPGDEATTTGQSAGSSAAGPAEASPDLAERDLAEATLAAPLRTDGFRLPDYEEVRLGNGLRLVLAEKRDVPLIAFQAVLAGGVVAEPPNLNGLAAVTAALLKQGAGARGAREFSEAVASVGGIFEIEAELESIVVRGEFMARNAALMVELLADVLRRPTLAPPEFDKVKARAIRSVTAARDSDPRALVLPYAHAFLFGEHPYGRALSGSEESLARLAHEDVLSFYRDQFGADRLTLTVIGDFDLDEMRARLEAALEGWGRSGAEPPEVPGTTSATGGRLLLVDKPGASQTYFWIGNLGVARADPQTPAVDLVNTLFGGRFTSMLNNALRVESGLTYGARSLLERHREPGSLGMLSFCATENTVEAIDLALAQLDRLHEEGLDATALASGRNYLLGTYTLALETGPQLAAALSELKFFDLPDAALDEYASRVAGVSRATSQGLIERVYPTRDELLFVLIGDADAIREQVSRYGDLAELAISTPRFRP